MEGWTRELYGMIRPWYIPWGTSERSVTAGAGEIVVGHGRVPGLLRYDSAGELKSIVRWQDQPDPVTSADRGRYSAARESWLARMPDDLETRFHFPALDEYKVVARDRVYGILKDSLDVESLHVYTPT